MQLSKPPLGIVPRCIHDEHRASEIAAGIGRYCRDLKPIPLEWIEELNEILDRLNKGDKHGIQ